MTLGTWAAGRKKVLWLSAAQRTLMLQIAFFVAYILLGALVFRKVEGWNYLNAVYWVDVTLLTVGFGDLAPKTTLGRSLLFPFVVMGIPILGLIVNSIRILIVQRGREKLITRLIKKRRAATVHDVGQRRQTIRISPFVKADFSTDPALSPAQRREEEFNIMRRVQAATSTERRWLALLTSLSLAIAL